VKVLKKWKKRNQWMIAFLAVLIAAAGYVNYSGFEIETKEAVSNQTPKTSGRVEDDDTPVGEAVLTSADVSNYVAQAKLNREQTHGKAKENLEAIISNEKLSENAKAKAVEKLTVLSENLEKEVAAEELLGAKGFLNSIVSIDADNTDVMILQKEVSKIEKAQIEDIIMRKTGCEVEDIVITTIKTDD
jgi:stage III sporulation protein AH